MTAAQTQVLETEEKLHDIWAHDFDPAAVPVDQFFTTPSCPENSFLLSKLGNLKGKKVLEIGSGTGEGAVFFAKCGAEATATDVSPGMLEVAERVARVHRVSIHTKQMDAAKLDFPDGSFDVVYGANVLHHVDTATCLREVHRVLKPGGVAAFWDPVKYNPLINVYRLIAHQMRSPDEHPLDAQTLAVMKKQFRSVESRFFWFATLGVFLKFYFIDQIHPNQERYWKKVIYDYPKIRGWFDRLKKIDDFILRLPVLRWLAWNMAVVLKK